MISINLTDYWILEKIIKAGDIVLTSNETPEIKQQIQKLQIAATNIQTELLKREHEKTLTT